MANEKALVKAYYDEHTKRKLQNFVYGNARVQAATEALIRWMLPNAQYLFEISCGIGYTTYEVANRVPDSDMTAFDISQRSVDIASLLFAKPGLRYLQADSLQDLTLPQDKSI